jgi:hypothetical protein
MGLGRIRASGAKAGKPLLLLFVACFTAHQHLGHIGPTLRIDKEYIRRGIATSRLLRQAGLGRGSILPTRCHTGNATPTFVACINSCKEKATKQIWGSTRGT